MRPYVTALFALTFVIMSAWVLQPAVSQADAALPTLNGPATATSLAATHTATTVATYTSTSTSTSAVASPTSTPSSGCVATWSRVAYVFEDDHVHAVAAITHYDAWAVGSGGILRWDGSSWHGIPVPRPPGPFDSLDLHAVSARQADDVWAAGAYSDGTNTHSIVYHWDGSAWSFLYAAEDAPAGGEMNVLEGITPIGPGEAIAVGSSMSNEASIITRCIAGTGCTPMIHPLFPGEGFLAVDASGPNDVWAVGLTPGSTRIEHYDGSSWQVVSSPDIGILHGIKVITPNDAWAVGTGGALHWDGSSWTQIGDFTSPIFAVDGIASDDVWAVGGNLAGDNIWHWDGTQWSNIASTYFHAQLNGVSALSTNDVWAVGELGYVTRYQTIRQFEDALPNSTFYYHINDLSCRGIVSGYPCGAAGEPCVPPANRPYFRPANNITRGQLSKIVALAAGFEPITDIETFEDVPIGSTFHPYVHALYVHGAITGFPCGGPGEPCIPPHNRPYFRPNALSSRAQIAKVVAISAGYFDPLDSQTFEDVPIGSPFYVWIENLAVRQIINGYPCGSPGEPCLPPGNRPYFRPSNNVTRGQMAKIAVITFFP